MKRLLAAVMAAVPLLCAGAGAAPGEEVSRSFEFRYFTNDPKANGETDFKGETAVFDTEERVAFLKRYAEYASNWFGDPGLDRSVVSDDEVAAALRTLKPGPQPSVRTRIVLDDWRWTGFRDGLLADEARALAVWTANPGTAVRDASLAFERDTTLRRGFAPQAWRLKLSWKARPPRADRRTVFSPAGGDTIALAVGFGPDGRLFFTDGNRESAAGGTAARKPIRADRNAGTYRAGAWHAFVLEIDLPEGRYNLTVDGVPVADFVPLRAKVGRIDSFLAEGPAGTALDDIVGTGFAPTDDVRRPYTTVTFLDENFEPSPDIGGWTDTRYDDRRWLTGTLPLVHGGERHAGEHLYLRKTVRVGTFNRAELSVETLDPGGEIWVNGEPAAVIDNRRPIRIDITRLLKPDAENLLAVRVRRFASTHPVFHAPNDHNIGWFAGRMHLDLTGDAFVENVFVHTTGTGNPAVLAASIALRNTASVPFRGTARVNLYPWFPAESSTPAATAGFPVRMTAWGAQTLDASIQVPRPLLWTFDSPNLYRIEVALEDSAGKAVDDFADTCGLRTVGQEGGTFRINGRPEMLNGAQIMGFRAPAENLALWNRCPPAEWLMRELLMIRRMNGNMLRVHVHAWSYPEREGGINDPRIAEMCDQLGIMLIWATTAWIRQGEVWAIDFEGYPEYMKQVYNHPSIVMWEVSNHPNRFRLYDYSESNRFYERMYAAVHPVDASRLISATSYIGWLHYGNDAGTIDYEGKPMTPAPEWTAPGVTRGNQDSVTGYGKEWSLLRSWPPPYQRDFLDSRERAYFNFEHEESTGQPNWSLVRGKPWYHLPSYEWPYDEGSIGRRLTFDEWRESQAWQAFSAFESMKKQRMVDYDGFSWCCLHGGPNSGTYWKPLADESCRAKLSFYINRMAFQRVLAGSGDVDVVYGPRDRIAPVILNLGDARTVSLEVTVRNLKGKAVFTKRYEKIVLPAGRTTTALAPFIPPGQGKGYYAVEYRVTK